MIFIELTSRGNIEQVYGPGYAVKEDSPVSHIEFALKYDDLNLDFLRAVFERVDKVQIEAFIEITPSGRCARKIGFLYELLTGKILMLQREMGATILTCLNQGGISQAR